MSTTTNTAQVTEYAAKIDSLAVFHAAARGHRSRMGYMPPISARTYGSLVERLGRMAQQGDRFAFIARTTIGRINLYGDRAQVCAAIFDGMAEAMATPFHDIIAATGPEAGRPSSHKHAWTLQTKVLAYAYAQTIIAGLGLNDSVDGYGWALVAVAAQEGVTLPPFPTRAY